MNSSNKIKSEKSKNVDEYIIGIPSDSHRNGQSENVLIVPDDIKPEPSGNSNDQFEYDVTYLDEDSDTEQTQEPQSDTSHQSTGSKRGTRAQIQLLSDYMQKHTDLSKCHDIVAKNEAWNSLSVQLNEIGPPIRTADQWRRAWTCIKSQRKRQAEMHTSDVKKQKRNAKNTTHLNNLPRSTKDTDIPKIEDKDERDNFHSKLLDRIDKFVEQQVRQGNQLEMLNKNLETLIGILAEKRT